MSDDVERREITTLGKLIEDLTVYARLLPEGAATPVGLAICDGNGLQFIDDKDLAHWAFVPAGDPLDRQWFVLFRGHHHPGENPGQYSPGVASDVDGELRNLSGGEEG